MLLQEFVVHVEGFYGLSQPERIKVIAYHMHTFAGRDRFATGDLRSALDQIGIAFDGNKLARDLQRLGERKPPEVLRDDRGYRLESRVRAAFDSVYGQAQRLIPVTSLLRELPQRVPGIEEREFLSEALACYRAGACRAAIVMGWNLAFDHVATWIVGDTSRLASFNTGIVRRFPKLSAISIVERKDFEELKESQVIDILGNSGLCASGVIDILREELKRRNNAAHPSSLKFTPAQAEHSITQLVENVVIPLA